MELYPDDFGLRGYSDRYPDVSDIHVPLYKELKSDGLVASGPARQKRFRLTGTGWDLAGRLFRDTVAQPSASSGRMSRTGAKSYSTLSGRQRLNCSTPIRSRTSSTPTSLRSTAPVCVPRPETSKAG